MGCIMLCVNQPAEQHVRLTNILHVFGYSKLGCFLVEALPISTGADSLSTENPDAEDAEEETRVFDKHDNLLHGDNRGSKSK